MDNTEIEILKSVINNYNKHAQIIIIAEKISELQEEILKNIGIGEPNEIKITERIADVEIMIELLKLIYDCSDEVKDIRKYKISLIKDQLDEIDC